MLNTEMMANILIDSNQDVGTVDNRQKIVSKRTTRSISSVLCTETQTDMHEIKVTRNNKSDRDRAKQQC